MQQTLENTITKIVGGKCIIEGYVKSGSIKVITFSSGIVKGENMPTPGIPESFNVLLHELRGLGLNITLNPTNPTNQN